MTANHLPPDVDAVAEALFAIEYGAYDPDAHPDHNRWTWRGDARNEPEARWRVDDAQVALETIAELLREDSNAGRALRDRLGLTLHHFPRAGFSVIEDATNTFMTEPNISGATS